MKVIDRLERVIRRQEFMRERFGPKAEARFLERKSELDQVVYSLLRLGSSFLARELYLQIESGESNFADLAKRYAEVRAEHQWHRRAGVPHPGPSCSCREAAVPSPAFCWSRFDRGWWLVVRLERYSRPRSRRKSPIGCAGNVRCVDR